MPIYEYECIKCGKIEEVVQKISDNPLTVCPHCSGKLQKLISQSSFHLKETSLYVTDYANRSLKPSYPPKAKETSAKTETKKPKKNADKAS
ncbi:MAG: zinc ribbon domain-containing protein [Deltaproteobacteria bacterium]|nr:zinc ribbon domain-containing protein [Deltaproteobacteria bacterium]